MKRLMTFILFIASLLSYITYPVHAQDSGDRVPYSVRAILPENQVNPDVSYFDIEVEPGASQSLEVDIFNASNEEITVAVSTHFGATNSNGIITYDGSITEYDESMELAFDEISYVFEEEVVIGPNDSQRAIVDVYIPEEGFDGQLLGGIHFKLEDEASDQDGAVGFTNEYAYVVGVNMVQADFDEDELGKDEDRPEAADNLSVEDIEAELVLDEVEPGLINHRTGVNATFSHKTPVLLDGLNFYAYVTEAGEDTVLYEREVENFSIGPNNQFNFPVDFANEPLEEGDYTYHAVVENNDYHWEFSQDFSLTEIESQELNEQAVELDEGWNWTYIVAFGLALIVILILVIIYLLRKLKSSQ